jgi:predicted PurR-regulated permease PerM
MSIAIMFVTQYFVYTESARLRGVVLGLSPLSGKDNDRILTTLRDNTSAAVLGGVLVAMIQGALGGIGFAIVGVDAPVLWGVVMALFSLLPFGGAAFVWVPVALFRFGTGQIGSGIFLVLWGAVLVGLVDNLLRPWILRRSGSNVHPMLLFFGILSGIGLFGMSGIVFGPLLIALLVTAAELYREHKQREDEKHAVAAPVEAGE